MLSLCAFSAFTIASNLSAVFFIALLTIALQRVSELLNVTKHSFGFIMHLDFCLIDNTDVCNVFFHFVNKFISLKSYIHVLGVKCKLHLGDYKSRGDIGVRLLYDWQHR
jgi:hypothetical protein